MNICKLCKEKLADKKGSHIVPHFLLKRIENVDGKSGRDYELGYTIGEADTEHHFGRSVSTEKLEEVFGELTDDEIEQNQHPLIVDHFFCTDCEKRLSIIESEYSKTVIKNDMKNFTSGVSSEIGLLFWASVIWRMSIQKTNGGQLTSGENEILRRILDRYLATSVKDIDIQKMREAKDLKKISYKLLRSSNYSQTDFTFLLFDPKFRKPYSLIVDEYILFFSFKNDYDNAKSKNFYLINEDITKISNNKVNSGDEQVHYVEPNSFSSINQSIINKLRDNRVRIIERFLNKLQRSFGHSTQFPKNWKQSIYSELTSNNKKPGRRYTLEDLKKSTIKVLSK